MTHGTLKARTGTVEIPGEFNYQEGGLVSFTADGTHFGVMYSNSEWEFVADAPEYPRDNFTAHRPGFYPLIRISGEWQQVSNGGGAPLLRPATEEQIAHVLNNPATLFIDRGEVWKP